MLCCADEAWHVAGKLEKEVNSAGGESKLKHYVFTHVHFDVAYNGNRIVVSLLQAVLAIPHGVTGLAAGLDEKMLQEGGGGGDALLMWLPAVQEINVSTDPAQMVQHSLLSQLSWLASLAIL